MRQHPPGFQEYLQQLELITKLTEQSIGELFRNQTPIVEVNLNTCGANLRSNRPASDQISVNVQQRCSIHSASKFLSISGWYDTVSNSNSTQLIYKAKSDTNTHKQAYICVTVTKQMFTLQLHTLYRDLLDSDAEWGSADISNVTGPNRRRDRSWFG